MSSLGQLSLQHGLPRHGAPLRGDSRTAALSLSLKPKKVYKHPIRVPSKVFPDAERTLGSRSFAELNPADKTSMATEVAKTFQLPSLKYEPCEGSCWQKEAGREVMTVVSSRFFLRIPEAMHGTDNRYAAVRWTVHLQGW
eukprot:1361354-Rhodomonas_salina.1